MAPDGEGGHTVSLRDLHWSPWVWHVINTLHSALGPSFCCRTWSRNVREKLLGLNSRFTTGTMTAADGTNDRVRPIQRLFIWMKTHSTTLLLQKQNRHEASRAKRKSHIMALVWASATATSADAPRRIHSGKPRLTRENGSKLTRWRGFIWFWCKLLNLEPHNEVLHVEGHRQSSVWSSSGSSGAGTSGCSSHGGATFRGHHC